MLWEGLKQKERQKIKQTDGLLDDISSSLPAILRAVKLQKRAASIGFDWPNKEPVINKIEEELNELKIELKEVENQLRIQDEMGDLLFSCVNLSRHSGVDPEIALRHANHKFVRRFKFIEGQLSVQNKSLADTSLEDMEMLWQEAKMNEKKSS